jgi:selenocysteine lyase/cysteine desulfurase
MLSTRRDFLQSLTSLIGSSVLLNDNLFANLLSEDKIIDPKILAKKYLIKKGSIYLNHASIGTVPKLIHEAHVKYLEICESNPSLYVWGKIWKDVTEHTRELACELIHCNLDDLAITHNTTEGFNVLAHGIQLHHDDEVLFSSLNHAGASMSWVGLSKIKDFKVRSFEFPLGKISSLDKQQIIDIYVSQIRPNTRVLIFPHIDNIIGLRHPMKELAEEAKRKGVEYVFVDGAQSLGMIPVKISSSKVDAYSMSPHKWLQAPKGTGMFYINKNLRKELPRMWYKTPEDRQDGSARKYEDYSTRAWPAVVALGDAIRYQNALGEKIKYKYYKSLWTETKLIVSGNKDLVWHSPGSWELASAIMSVEVKNKDANELSEILDTNYGIHLRPFRKPVNALRISPNTFNSIDEIKTLLNIVTKKV